MDKRGAWMEPGHPPQLHCTALPHLTVSTPTPALRTPAFAHIPSPFLGLSGVRSLSLLWDGQYIRNINSINSSGTTGAGPNLVSKIGGTPELLRHRKIECRSNIELGLDHDASSVVLEDLSAGRQTDAGAGILLGGVEALEKLENFAAAFLVHANAIVGDSESPFCLGFDRADMDD